ncbi:MAG: helix-turn-helix domain-containing protein [Planctomycetota bacterium]|jgi:Zn-dependent peptidase ImmA (M78 family)
MDIAARLKIAREAIGYTLRKASEESGIGDSSISEFENSRREPKFSHLSRLAQVYKKGVEFFLTDAPILEDIMLWRDEPDTDVETKEMEADFQQLCEQYHKLEVLTGEVKKVTLPQPNASNAEQFDFADAELLAKEVQDLFRLGDVPIASLKRRLEETYYVKIFYLDFSGSAISTVSEKFGPAILLNRRNRQWRRSYDLAHELFHILTWHLFRSKSREAADDEEKLANAFASRLLMPEESIKDRIKRSLNDQDQVSLGQLDDIAREYDVSLMALIYRLAGIFRLRKEETRQYIDAAEKYLESVKARLSYEPPTLPERYCDLASRALREGKLSLMQFAKYMEISYRKAQEYLTEDEDFTDEKVSISLA